MEITTAVLEEIVDTDYIQESLDKVAHAEGFRNYKIKIYHGATFGDGFVGFMVKAELQELDQSKFLTVLAKIPSRNEIRREVMNSESLFKREIFIYNVYLPELVKFQEEHKISKEKGFFNFPKVYFAEYNEERDDAIIIMEDLRESNFRMWDKYKPINFDHAKLLISALGRLHGLSLAIKIKKPEWFEKLKELNDFTLKIGEKNKLFKISETLKNSLLMAVESLETNDVERKDKIMNLLDGLMDKLFACVDGKAAEPYSVVTHGDCWINNFFFNYGKHETPTGIKLIDWQLSRYCSPVSDLLYFIFVSTDREFRVKHWDELINIYHQSLVEIIKHIGSDITHPSIAELHSHLRKFGKFGVVMATLAVPIILIQNYDFSDLTLMAELRTTNKNPVLLEELNKKYEQQKASGAKIRLREIIEDSIEYGYL